MIKPPSLIHDYTLIYSGDPALNLPSDEEERDRALKTARETGKWDALLTGKEQPTIFHLRPIVGTALDYLIGQRERLQLTDAELAVLALRLALKRVENFGEHKVVHYKDKDHGVVLASTAIIDAIYTEGGAEHGRKIVGELGGLVIGKALEALGPL